MKGFFITGTDTEIGKTFVTCLLMQRLVSEGYKVAGLKPIASGCEQTDTGLQNSDALAISSSANVDLLDSTVNRYRFRLAIAPHIAAEQDGTRLSLDSVYQDLLTASELADFVFVEGVGGWNVPLGDNVSVADLASRLALPVIVVVGIRLGCINHALLTINSVRQTGIPIAGWIANRCEPQADAIDDNIKSIQQRVPEPMLADIAYGQQELNQMMVFWD